MKKLSPIFVIPLMLLGAFLVPSLAHAGTGVVSVNGGNIVTAAQTDTTVSIGIQISGSDPINGFDVQVSADHSILQGASVSLTGSVLPSPSVVVECIDGVLIAGSTCAPTDTIGVVHLAASTLGGLTANPTTGLLFTINYKIVGSTAGTPVSFTTGCVGTSITNGDCVTIANGTRVAVPETDQGSTFANLIDFTNTAAFAKVSTPAGVHLGVVFTFVSEGGFADGLAVTVVASSGLTATLATSSVVIPPTATDTLTVSAAATGSYSATVTGCGTFAFPGVCHSATVMVLVAPAGFTVSLSQPSVTIARGNSDSSTKVSLAGNSGFGGTVSFTASVASGITGSAPMATLTSDASGYSTASSTLTISVGSSVATGTYALTLTGMSGSSSGSASISVVVPGQDFSIAAVPAAISINRGGSVALSVNIFSLGNFAGTASFSATVTPIAGQQDSCCLTNNIVPAFSPANPTLTAGGSVVVAFFAATVGGTAPPATYTATGNYTATITATIGSVTHSVLITFNIEDFSVGPAYCIDETFSNNIYTSPNANQFPVPVTTVCNTLTITDQPNITGPANLGTNTLWVQSNAFGGLVTDGWNGTPAIAALNPQSPVNGFVVPQLAAVLPAGIPLKMCLLPTFWPNGTQVPYSYLIANGPLITPGMGLYTFLSIVAPNSIPPGFSNWGCKFDAGIFPNDHGVGEYNDFQLTHNDKTATHPAIDSDVTADLANEDHNGGVVDTNECLDDPACPYPTVNNPDFWPVTAMAIQGTVAAAYTFQLCGQTGTIIHCHTYGLNVVKAPVIHQLVVKKSVSFSASGGNVLFKFGVSNPDLTFTVYAQVTVTGIGNLGDSFTVTSAVVTIGPGGAANNIAFSVPLIASEIGETFSFTFSIAVSTDPNNLTGTSTLQAITRTFIVTP